MTVISSEARADTEHKRISIGVVLYENSASEIGGCLDAIARQSRPECVLEVLFRDQSGKCLAPVLAWAEEHQQAFEIRTFSGENVGFGGGHNALFREVAAQSHAYLCLNPDGTLHPDCVAQLVDFAESRSWKGIFEAIQEPIMHPKHFDPQSGATAWCSGACVLIPNEVYRAIEGFDEKFFLYCEDVDLSWRVKALGLRCYTAAEALFFHYAVERSSRAPEMWKSAYALGHKWRAPEFKEFAFNNLAAMFDIDPVELKKHLDSIDEMAIESVLKASPDFRHNLVFATPMWS
ncbi:glycosyltransferase family 2 protein [Paraburkholderia fungorum]|uniref:glycosyltransferase family 2 protein n=1 Tax=Paraburkholderia fungorum TaxID=134537 RepID=UPI000DB60D28|nr:glycosyltransferase family 2 protein [Paraburkholderia fungorum]PZR43053.1 MAG: glycosyltransferase [Paraburkholderia fungorum]